MKLVRKEVKEIKLVTAITGKCFIRGSNQINFQHAQTVQMWPQNEQATSCDAITDRHQLHHSLCMDAWEWHPTNNSTTIPVSTKFEHKTSSVPMPWTTTISILKGTRRSHNFW